MALGRQEPVRLYAEEDIRLPRRLSALLKERIEGYSTTILEGNLSPERYNELVGTVKGLKEALQISEDLSKELAEN